MNNSNLFKTFLLVLIAAMLSQMASAYDLKDDRGFAYNFNSDGSLCVTYDGTGTNGYGYAYSNLNGDLNIPSVVHFYHNGQYMYSRQVTSIGDYAFYGCWGVTSMTIPNSVTSIGGNAFNGCSGLTSMIIPNSVTSISNQAFFSCSGLTSVTIPNSVISIGRNAFVYCRGLTNVNITDLAAWCNINFGSSTANPLYYATNLLLNGSKVTNLVIPNTVTTIKPYTFSGYSGLTSLTIPNSVTSIDGWAFSACSGLTSIEVESGNTKYDSRNYCNAIIETATNRLITGCKNTIIPNSVRSIGDYAFYGCSGLTSVTIPNSVTEIGYEAFESCSSLTRVNISDLAAWCNIYFSDYASNPLYCAYNLYLNGDKVTNLVLPNTVTKIGDYAFINCSGMTSVTIPNSVTSIGEYAFDSCSGLTSLTIPNSVSSIGYGAFSDCTGLKKVNISDLAAWCNIDFGNLEANPTRYAQKLYLNNSLLTKLVIPNSVKVIKDYTFNNCAYLTSITFHNSLTSIGNIAFLRCYGLTSVTIPNSVTSIGAYAFQYCENLDSLILSSSLKTIGDYALSICPKLTSVSIPSSVTKIGDYAFWQDTGLTSVTIPKSVTAIGSGAFKSCTGLTTVKSWIENPNNVQLGNCCFDEISNDCLLYVLNASYSSYLYADVWKDFHIVLYDDIKPNIIKLSHVRGERFVKVTIPFNMNNYDEISGFQFDITLPEGMSVATDSYGENNVWLNSDRKARNHSIDVSQLLDNTYRVLASSPTNNKFKGNDGVVMYLELAFSREHPIGNYNVYIDNVELVAPDESRYIGAGASIAVDYRYLLGDADCDARVDIADYTVTALKILNRPVDTFYFDAANVNDDNQISVADLAGIVNIALGIRDHEYCQAPSITNNSADDAFSTPSLNVSVEDDNVVMLGLDNDIPLAGMQLDLHLPQGMTVAEVSLEGRAANYQIATSTLPDGSVRLLISSFSDKDIETSDDAILKLVLDGNSVNNDMLYITGAQAVSRDLTTYYIEDVSVPISTTSINTVNNDSEKLKVYGTGNTIVVDSPSDMLIQVVHVNGMVMPVEVKAGRNTIDVGGHGVYIIKVGNSVYKVRL